MHTDQTVLLFRLNTRLFPNSTNAFDSLVEGLIKIDDVVVATEAYQEVLELEPGNPVAKPAILKLRARK